MKGEEEASKNPLKASVIIAKKGLWYETILIPCGKVLV